MQTSSLNACDKEVRREVCASCNFLSLFSTHGVMMILRIPVGKNARNHLVEYEPRGNCKVRLSGKVVGRIRSAEQRKEPLVFCESVSSNSYADGNKSELIEAKELPTQGDAMVAGVDPIDYINQQLQDILKPPETEDYLAVRLD